MGPTTSTSTHFGGRDAAGPAKPLEAGPSLVVAGLGFDLTVDPLDTLFP
jgi:hypothetical protein